MPENIQVEGLGEAKARLSALPRKLGGEIARRVNVAVRRLQARILTSLVTGEWGIKARHGLSGLVGTVQVTPATPTEDGKIVGMVHGGGGNPPVGLFFEKGGRGPYPIEARPGGVLAWPAYGKWQSPVMQRAFAFTKDTIFAKRVMHPAVKHAPWMRGPLKEMKTEIEEMINPVDAVGDLF